MFPRRHKAPRANEPRLCKSLAAILINWPKSVVHSFGVALRLRRLGTLFALVVIGCVLFFCTFNVSASQGLHLDELDRRSWTAADGAPLHLYKLVEDRDGFLWMVSVYGLYKFDGFRFSEVRLPSDLDPTGIGSLKLTADGTIWTASNLGTFLSIEHGRVTSHLKDEGIPSVASFGGISEFPAGSIWVVCNHRLLQFRSGKWYDETRTSGLPGEPVTTFSDLSGMQWVVTSRAVVSRSPGESRFHATNLSWSANLKMPQAIAENAKGDLWIDSVSPGEAKSIVRQIKAGNAIVPHGNSFSFPYIVYDINFDHSGALWIAGSGVTRITNPGGQGSAKPVLEHLGGSQAGISVEAHGIAIDTDGDVWITSKAGIERFRTPVLVGSTEAMDAASYPDVAQGSNGDVFLGVRNRPILKGHGGKLTPVGKVIKNGVFCLFVDRSGTLWFHDRQSLWRETKDDLTRVAIPQGLDLYHLRKILQSPEGLPLFIFREQGTWTFTDGKWNRVQSLERSGAPIATAIVDHKGDLWAGYTSGAVVEFTSRGPRSYLSPASQDLGYIYGIFDTTCGTLVTDKNSIAIARDGRLRRLHFADDLPVRGISGIVQSADGAYWLNGSDGVVRISAQEFITGAKDPKKSRIHGSLFRETHVRGPAPVTFDMPTAARDATGRLWFNTSDTIASVDPAALKAEKEPPILSVSAVVADGQKLQLDQSIPAGTNTVRIQYFGSNLTAPEKVRYRYRLTGVDRDWQDVADRTEAVYTQLRPGRHKFEVLATSDEGIWTAPVTETILVLPLFYQTNWFRILVALLCCVVVACLYHLRIRHIKMRLRQLAEERADERVSIARDLHDTLLQGVQGLMLSFHVAVQEVRTEGTARQMLEQALDKAERIIIEGRDRVSKLRSDNLREVSLPDALQALGSELNEPPTAAFHLTVVERERQIYPPVKEEFFCIAREAITNSFRHSRAREIVIELAYETRRLTMTCRDDGCGFDPCGIRELPRSDHYGVVGMQERAKKIGASFECDSSPGHGTKVVISVPGRLAYLRVRSRFPWLLVVSKEV